MSALTLTLKQQPGLTVDVSSLIPDQLAGHSVAEIAALPLSLGKRSSSVAELFELSGDDGSELIFNGDCSQLDNIGAGMRSGSITVKGHAGYRCGTRLHGGQLVVEGNAGAYSGAGMRAGRLEIHGNAGDFLGAAIPGEKQGMNGGQIVVHGHAADRVGDRLRRGTIIVHGDAGDYCGSRLIAGNIVVAGQCGQHAGYLMKRGTLVFKTTPQSFSPGIAGNGTITLPFLNLLLRELAQVSAALPAQSADCRVQRYLGDRAAGGIGEILVLPA